MTTTKNKARRAKATPPVENITNDATRTVTDAMLGVGECQAQGDLYIVRLPGLPASARPRRDRQLADGNTQGSRHVCTVGDAYDADADELVRMIRTATRCGVGRQYVGPVIRTVEGKAYVEHPEHGDLDFRGDMVLAVVFQRALDAEEREARVAD